MALCAFELHLMQVEFVIEIAVVGLVGLRGHCTMALQAIACFCSMMARIAAFPSQGESSHIVRPSFLVGRVTSLALKSLPDHVRPMGKGRAKDIRGNAFDAGMTSETGRFEGWLRPRRRKSAHPQDFPGFVDLSMGGLEDLQTVGHVVNTVSLLDEIDILLRFLECKNRIRGAIARRALELPTNSTCSFDEHFGPVLKESVVGGPMTAHARNGASCSDWTLCFQMAAFAANTSEVHHIGKRIDALCTDTGVEITLGRVSVLMANRTFRRGIRRAFWLDVTHFEMTICALDLMVRDVNLMHLVDLFEFLEPVFLVVTSDAAFAGYATFVRASRRVTRLTLHTETGNFTMVEVDTASTHDSVGNLVTESASGSTSSRLLALEMADQAARGSDPHMCALNDLRMARGATKLFATA